MGRLITYQDVNEFIKKEKLNMPEVKDDGQSIAVLFDLIVAVNKKHKSEDNEEHF